MLSVVPRMPPQRLNSPQRTSSRPPVAPPHTHEVVDPRWLLKALLAALAVAVACAYVLVCALFYLQQWQLVLHPSRTVAQLPSSAGLQYEEVHFFPDASGHPQLDGWWMPGDTPGEPTALLLHNGSGSMSDSLQDARALHDARLNVFLFDYRGFGRSAGQHPTKQSMEADSEAALAWLGASKNVASAQTIVFGDHLGASLAVRLCAQHQKLAGLILQQGDGDFASRAAADRRAKIVPFRLLFHEDFPLADPLHALATPKLLISYTEGRSPVDVQRAADPKMTFEIDKPANTPAIHEALRRFLETYLTQPPAELLPNK